ncbi:hypothetical protein B0H14DRAFT_3862579 [Mycena olivaceomarginata]|nr:hypothetical protein B0H14DRAFT_3862579 [Mycena olivaceomarginata]
MGSAQSTLTPETVLTAAVVVGGAVAIGYSTLAPGSSSSGSGAESKAKKSKRKSTAGVTAAVAGAAESPAPVLEPKKSKSKAKPKPAESPAAPVLTASSSLPGAFDGAPDPDEPKAPLVKAHSKKAKKKASAASVSASAKASPPSAPLPVPAPAPAPEVATPTPPAAAAPVAKPKKTKGKKKAPAPPPQAGESTDDGWTRVGDHTNTSASTTTTTEDSLPEEDEEAESEAEEIPLPGMRPKASLNKPPKRPLAERLLPKPRKTGVDERMQTRAWTLMWVGRPWTDADGTIDGHIRATEMLLTEHEVALCGREADSEDDAESDTWTRKAACTCGPGQARVHRGERAPCEGARQLPLAPPTMRPTAFLMLPASSPDYPALARVMRVVPGTGQRTPTGSHSADPLAQEQEQDTPASEDVDVDDADDEDLRAALALSAAEADAGAGWGADASFEEKKEEEEGAWDFVPVKRRGAGALLFCLVLGSVFLRGWRRVSRVSGISCGDGDGARRELGQGRREDGVGPSILLVRRDFEGGASRGFGGEGGRKEDENETGRRVSFSSSPFSFVVRAALGAVEARCDAVLEGGAGQQQQGNLSSWGFALLCGAYGAGTLVAAQRKSYVVGPQSTSFTSSQPKSKPTTTAGAGAQAKKNAKRKEAEKAAKAEADAVQAAALAAHRRAGEAERMRAQASSGNPKVGGGMKASVDAGGRLVWD